MNNFDNKEVLKKAIQHWNNGEYDEYLKLYDSNAIAHHIPSSFSPGIIGIRKFYEGFWSTFSSSEILIHDLIGEGGKVSCRYTVNATNSDSGESIMIRSITILRFSNGKCIERWDADEN